MVRVNMKDFLAVPSGLRQVITKATSSNPQQIARPEGEGEDAIALLPEEEKDGPYSSRRPRGASLLNGRTRKTWLLIALVGIGLIVAAFMLPSRRRPSPPPHREDGWKETEYYFHLVLPTSTISADFCKTLLSAATLNFPTPWLINWDGDAVDDPTLLKMRAVTHWLGLLPPERDDDPVIILGNVNAWFQVRPEVMLERYFGILQRGDRRVESMFSKKVIKKQGLRTRIVFSSEKDCQLTEEKQSVCLATAAEDGSLHYLSTNLVMGSAKDLRELWQHATEHAERLAASSTTIDENKIFAQLLGDQDMHRASISKSKWTNELFKVSDKGEEDLGIMLDFGRELSYAADDKLQGVDWVRHTGQVEDEDLSIPADIDTSTPPFWNFAGSNDLPNSTWSDVPLLTGLRANIVPALVHMGPKADTELSSSWWSKMWHQPYGRQLLDAFAFIPSTPLAVLRDDRGREHRYWSPHFDKVGAKDEVLGFHDWNELCAMEESGEEVARQVFLDEQGLWVDPRP